MYDPLDGLNVACCSMEIVRAHILVFTNTEKDEMIIQLIKHCTV